jgi:hypothetical protein
MKVEFSRQILEKRINIKFYQNPSSGNRVVPCRRIHGQTWRVAFHDLATAPKNTTRCRLLKASDIHCKAIPRRYTQLAQCTASSYGLDNPWFETRWQRDFPYTPQHGPGTHPASCTQGPFSGCKAAWEWRYPTTPFCDEVNLLAPEFYI